MNPTTPEDFHVMVAAMMSHRPEVRRTIRRLRHLARVYRGLALAFWATRPLRKLFGFGVALFICVASSCST